MTYDEKLLKTITNSNILKYSYEIIRKDKELWEGFKANIAMAFVDEYQKEMESVSKSNYQRIHKIANQSADNFLRLLTKK